MKLKCLLGHVWQKQGGACNVGGGTFEQRFICKRCGKTKFIRS